MDEFGGDTGERWLTRAGLMMADVERLIGYARGAFAKDEDGERRVWAAELEAEGSAFRSRLKALESDAVAARELEEAERDG
jgi:hypothetical protein